MGETLRYAKDYKCCVCGQPAVVWWPMIDPDIEEHPYCRPCVEKAKTECLMKIYKIDEETLPKRRDRVHPAVGVRPGKRTRNANN